MSTNRLQEVAGRLAAGMERVLVGADRMTFALTVALLARGHVLIEGVPGTGKTLAVRALALLLGLEFRRIAFTPDLMPSDVVGTTVFNPQTAQFTHAHAARSSPTSCSPTRSIARRPRRNRRCSKRWKRAA